jgi:hypothetical protein
MIRRKHKRFSKKTRSASRTKQIRTPIANSEMALIRKPSRPPPAEPYHVAVDRQLKSGHQTYEAAEKAGRVKDQKPVSAASCECI